MMESKVNISINWQMEIPFSNLFKLYDRGTFSLLKNNEIVMAYNQINKYFHHEKGKLVRIKQRNVEEIFKTERQLWAPIVDNENIYLVTSSFVNVVNQKSEKGTLFKFSHRNILDWQYQLDGEATSLPVIWQDSIFITDFIRSRSHSSRKSGHIYRLNKNGDLILKKPIQHFNHFEPWILKEKEQIILSFEKNDTLVVLDFKGNIKMEKSVSKLGTPLFSENTKGDIFACINNSIVALDGNLHTFWEYKPVKGFPYRAPAIDSQGNLYTLCNFRRLVSIDSKGKERWVIEIPGEGYQPCILNSGDILTVTSDPSGKKANEEQYLTYVNMFSNDGKRLSNCELPGYVFHTAIGNKDTIFIATNSRHINVKEETEIWSVNIFSLKLS
jgi:outer membrane protein assembly factor BamB